MSLDATINYAARKFGVSPVILKRLLVQESGLRENVTSPAGARDIAQFMPATARQYGVRLGDNNPTDDILGAAHYLADNLRRTGGSYAQALSIYNSGRPNGYLSIPETRQYVDRIMGGAPQAQAQGSAQSVPQGPQGRSVTVPGVDNSQARKMAILQFIQTRERPGSALTLAQGLDANPDVPSSTIQIPGGAGQAQQGQPGKGGVVNFGGKPVAAWIAPILQYARQHGWMGSVTSGYRSLQEQTQIYNRGTRPAAKPGTSNHEFTAFPGGAVDVTNAQQLAQIIGSSPFRGKLVWAGGKDPVHFSHPHGGAY